LTIDIFDFTWGGPNIKTLVRT